MEPNNNKNDQDVSTFSDKKNNPEDDNTETTNGNGGNECEPRPVDNRTQLLLGAVFGIIFGFLLQKGGVAKYEVLIGVLLLKNFTVVKVMLTAVVVGMLGVNFMHYKGIVKLHLKPTQYYANIIGGLIFGIGFALSAYCPGTGAAALGQGNFDAIAVIFGLLAGSYIFALFSGPISRTIQSWGNAGELTLDQVFQLPKPIFILGFSLVLVIALLVLQIWCCN